MRAHIGGRHVGVSARVPNPINVAGGIILLPIQLLNGLVVVITAFLPLIGWIFKALWWIVVKLLLVVGCLLLAVTAPIWWPARGWWRHHNKVLVRKVERRQRHQAAKTFAKPPAGARVG